MVPHSKRIRLHRTRSRIEGLWEPEWNDEIVGWTVNFIRKNRWRTETFNDYDDLLQDAFIVFMRIRDTYPRCVQPRHFMKLYQNALWNSFMDKGRKLRLEILTKREVLKVAQLYTPEMVDFNYGPLSIAIQEGPPELRMLLAFMADNANIEKLRQPQRHRASYSSRMNIDQRLSKLLGISYYPFREALRKWLFA